MNICDFLEMAAESFGNRVAVSCGTGHLDYSGLRQAAHNLAARVRADGTQRLGHLATSSLVTPAALFAAAIAGVPYVPLNYRLSHSELAALLSRIASATLVAESRYLADIVVPSEIAVLERENASDEMYGKRTAIVPAAEAAIAVELFTSGTTGQPKSAVLKHENLFSYVIGSVEFGGAGEEEATLVAVPPYHIAGISVLLTSVYAGRRIVLLPNFDPAEWLLLCKTERITHAFLVPTMLKRIVEMLGDADAKMHYPQLRAIAYGGGPMPRAVIELAMARLPHVDFTNAYGLTETSSTICVLGPDEHRAAAASNVEHIRRRLASVGLPIPSVKIEVRDDRGSPVAPGVSGRIYVRGEQVSGEYTGTGTLLDQDGWFDTRDRGLIDAEGFVYLEGRADDVIVRGGENISPGEIEDVLLSHPAIAEVAVVGIPSDEWGETVAAAVVTSRTVEVPALQQWVRNRLRSSRVPEQIRFVEALPYNEMGKLLRRVVRATFIFGGNTGP